MGSIVSVHGVAASGSRFTFNCLLRGNVLSILIELVAVSSGSEWMGSEAVRTVLAVFSEIAESALFDLDKEESAQFLTLCVRLMEALQRHNERRTAQIDGAAIKEQCRELQRGELLEMLKLMEFMASKDMMMDLKDGGDGHGLCLFRSLYVLTPMLCPDLLSCKALSERFHEVLSLSVRGFTLCFAAKLTAEQRYAAVCRLWKMYIFLLCFGF